MNVSPPLACAVGLLLFLVPGLALTLCFEISSPVKRLAAAVILSSLLGYATFWVYFVSPEVGDVFSGACMLCSAAWIGWRLWKRRDARDAFRALLLPISINVLVVVLYSAILNIVPSTSGQLILANDYFFPNWLDNLFPKTFAEKIFQGANARLLGPWHSSERPPLQSGALLLLGIPYLNSDLWYQAVGTAVQSSWIVAMFFLAETLALSQAAARRVVLFCVFSGFFFLETVFTWPKMFGGALTVMSLSLFFKADLGGRDGRRDFYLASIAAGCAWMAHPATGFAAICLGAAAVVALRRRGWDRGSLTLALGGAVTFAVILLPWSLYRHFYDTQSPDTLAQYHLALWSDPESVPKSLWKAYTSRPFAELAERKLNNLKALFTNFAPYEQAPIGWRRLDYYHVFHALGVLNLGWLVFIYHRTSTELKKLLPALTAAITITAVWILGEFGPTTREMLTWVQQAFNPPVAATIIHQGPYSIEILLFFVLAFAVQAAPAVLWLPALGVSVAMFSYFYVITPRLAAVHGMSSLDWPMVTVTMLAAAAILALCLRSDEQPQTRGLPH